MSISDSVNAVTRETPGCLWSMLVCACAQELLSLIATHVRQTCDNQIFLFGPLLHILQGLFLCAVAKDVFNPLWGLFLVCVGLWRMQTSTLPAKAVVSQEILWGGGNKKEYPVSVMPLRGSICL